MHIHLEGGREGWGEGQKERGREGIREQRREREGGSVMHLTTDVCAANALICSLQQTYAFSGRCLEEGGREGGRRGGREGRRERERGREGEREGGGQ